jgi:hypothetical protein
MAKKDMEIEMEEMPVDNVGIMQGFLEMMNEDDDLEEGDDDLEAGIMLGRTPDSPEILMNNLRGDMRSIDARRDELADMVGYAAAAETPESVLAMLQPVLAQQGIGAMMPPGMGLPPGPSPVSPVGAPNVPNVPNVPNMPSEMMAPMEPMPAGGIGDMAPGAMPPGPPPVQMARGGEVQRFSRGGVTGADASEEDDASMGGFPNDVRELARQSVMKLIAKQPTRTSDLATLAGQREKIYQDVLGSNQGDLAKLGFLTSLGERGFAYAANVDPITGQPLRGSALSRFAGAARGLPAEMMKMAAAKRKEDQAIKMASLESAEKQISAEREANVKLIDSQTKAYRDILKAEGSPFGKGAWEWKIVTTPELLARWSMKETTEDEDNLVESAISKLRERSLPRTEVYTDAGGVKREIVYPAAPFPDFVTEAVNLRKQGAPKPERAAAPGAGKGAPGTRPTAQGPDAPGAGAEVTPSGVRIERPLAFKPEGEEMPDQAPAASMVPQPPKGMNRLTSYNPQFQGLYQIAPNIAGPGAWAASKISGVPGLGDPFPEVTQAMSNAQVAVEDLIEATMKSRVGAMGEQNRLRNLYRVGPQFFKDPAAYRSELVALDNVLENRLYKEIKNANDKSLAEKDQLASREVIKQITNLRERFNILPKVFSEEEALRYPGQTILWYGVTPMKVPQTAPQGQ